MIIIVNLQKWSTWLDSNQRYSSAQVRRPRSDWPTGRHIKIKPKLEREAGLKTSNILLGRQVLCQLSYSRISFIFYNITLFIIFHSNSNVNQ